MIIRSTVRPTPSCDPFCDLALVPQTLAQFIHIVTDGKRMPQPLTMEEAEAISRVEHRWQAEEVVRVCATALAHSSRS
jgi:hypothetical protein